MCVVGLSTAMLLGACAQDEESGAKAARAERATTTTTSTTTTVPSTPPTTVFGPPESYKVPPSWPTDPSQADPTKADLVYVQHVVDGFAAIEQLAMKALLATMSVNDEAQAISAEYVYNDEVFDADLEVMQGLLDRDTMTLLPGRMRLAVDEVVSISPRCFVALVTVNASDAMADLGDPYPGFIWMGIPLDSRPHDVNPSPWRVLDHGGLEGASNDELLELRTRCSLEVD